MDSFEIVSTLMDSSDVILLMDKKFKKFLKTAFIQLMAQCQIWRESNLSAYDPMHSMHSMHIDNSHHSSMIQIYGIMANGRSQIDSACDSGHSGHLGHMDNSHHLSTPLINFIVPLNSTESSVQSLTFFVIFVISV
ncbi:MAG: hypothetical protein EZS28_034121 [Streblomastix strix]|uniref:Uncharacterized protein n=1 Tax=Streblomastix strix TaxID=222440 RepID=A0A5J4UK70_9EUKA|nr:MAG: hypothetical protein EZS28_034121 [Streblomastix strix]